MIVDKWFTPGWAEKHDAAWERRLQMQGTTHHQGNRCLAGYKQLWVREFIYLF
jgi:hypothetical protein